MSTRRMTIVQIVPSLESGGVERGTVELSEELVRRGHRSLVVSGGGKLVDALIAHGGEHVTWNVGKKSPLTARYILPLRRLLRREQVDILHVRSRVPGWVAWLAWKGMDRSKRPRLVTTAHGLYSVNRFSEVMTRGERVIAISETVRDYLRQSYPRLDDSLIRVIPRGVDTDEFPRGFQPSGEWIERWYDEYPQLLGRPVISLIGRITRCKGHTDFVEIVDRLRSVIPEIQGLIVGGVDQRRKQYADEVRRLIDKRSLDSHITMTGHRRDVREIYAVSNIVLTLTSDPPEAFGRATIEALTMGVPVVGYDHGGTGEILRNVFPQGVVAAGNKDDAVASIARILQEGTRVPDQHPYLKARMLEETLSVYDELAA